MALVFPPAANAVLGAVRPSEAGQASGATNTIREIGGVLGVAPAVARWSCRARGAVAAVSSGNDGQVREAVAA